MKISEINRHISVENYKVYEEKRGEIDTSVFSRIVKRYDRESKRESIDMYGRDSEDLILYVERNEFIRNIIINNLDSYDEKNLKLFFGKKYRTWKFNQYNDTFLEYYIKKLYEVDLLEIYKVRKEIYSLAKIYERNYILDNIIIVSFRVINKKTGKELQIETDFDRLSTISGNIVALEDEIINIDGTIEDNINYFNKCMKKEIEEESCLDVEFNDSICKIRVPEIEVIIENEYRLEHKFIEFGRHKKYVIEYIVEMEDDIYNSLKREIRRGEFIEYVKLNVVETTAIFM